MRISRLDIVDEENFTGFKGRTVCVEEAMLLESVSKSAESFSGSLSSGSVGIVIGVDGPVEMWKKEFFGGVLEDGSLGASPLMFPYTSHNSLAARLSIEYGVKGQNLTITSGPLSFLKALCEACIMIDSGVADIIIAGGVGLRKGATTVLSVGDDGLCVYDVKDSMPDKKNDSAVVFDCIEDSFYLIDDLMKGLSRVGEQDDRVLNFKDCYGASGSFVMGFGSVIIRGRDRIA